MQGRRRPDNTPEDELLPGDFCKIPRRDVNGRPGPLTDEPGPQWWAVRPPTAKWPGAKDGDPPIMRAGLTGRLNPSVHTVVEHEDGMITVVPSIKQEWGSGEEVWHGFLERGVWREC